MDQAWPDWQGRACCVCPACAQCGSADTATLTFPDATSYDPANTSANETLTWLDSLRWHTIILPKKTACWRVCVGEAYVWVCLWSQEERLKECMLVSPSPAGPCEANKAAFFVLMIDVSKSR